MSSEIKDENIEQGTKEDAVIEKSEDSDDSSKETKNNSGKQAAEESKENKQADDKATIDKSEKSSEKDKTEDTKDLPVENKDHAKVKEDPKGKKESTKKKAVVETESDEESGEEEVGLLDRPVEVSGCRARKKVERLTISMTTPTEKKKEFPEGRGKKLGDCPGIELQLQKTKTADLKNLHKILFNRPGSGNEIKKNIRKFSGFAFEEDSTEFSRKKASLEKLTMDILKEACSVLDLAKTGKRNEVVDRIMSFLLKPEDSGKKVTPAKKKVSKNKPSKEKVNHTKLKGPTSNPK